MIKKLITTFLLAAKVTFAQSPVEYIRLQDFNNQQSTVKKLSTALEAVTNTPSWASSGSTTQLTTNLDVNGNDIEDISDQIVTILGKLSVTNYDASGLWVYDDGTFLKYGEPGTGTLALAAAAVTDDAALYFHPGTYTETSALGFTEDRLKFYGVAGTPQYNYSATTNNRAITGGAIIEWTTAGMIIGSAAEGFHMQNMGMILQALTASEEVLQVNNTAADVGPANCTFIDNVFVVQDGNDHGVIDQHIGSRWMRNILVGGVNGALFNGSGLFMAGNETIDAVTTGVIIKADPLTHSTIQNMIINGHHFRGIAHATAGFQVQAINEATVNGIVASNLTGTNTTSLVRIEGTTATTGTVSQVSIVNAVNNESSANTYWVVDGDGVNFMNCISDNSAQDAFHIAANGTNVMIVAGIALNVGDAELQNDGHALYTQVNSAIEMEGVLGQYRLSFENGQPFGLFIDESKAGTHGAAIHVIHDGPAPHSFSDTLFLTEPETSNGGVTWEVRTSRGGLDEGHWVHLYGAEVAVNDYIISNGQPGVGTGTGTEMLRFQEDDSIILFERTHGTPIDTVTGISTSNFANGTVLMDTSSAPGTNILANISSDNIGLIYTYKRKGGNAATLDGDGADTIDGAATLSLVADNDCVKLQSSSPTEWEIVGTCQ